MTQCKLQLLNDQNRKNETDIVTIDLKNTLKNVLNKSRGLLRILNKQGLVLIFKHVCTWS